MWKKRQIIILHVNMSNMCKVIDLKNNSFTIKIAPNKNAFVKQTNDTFCIQPFEIHILSDEKPKEGDWCISKLNEIIQFKKNYNSSLYKKIIATTDSTLKVLYEGNINNPEKDFGKIRESLPQPSQDFIKVFVEEYNKGNIITEIEVDYEWFMNKEVMTPYHVEENGECVNDFRLKVNSNNEISIRSVERKMHRKEVITLLKFFIKDTRGDKPWVDADDEWVEENL